MTIGDNIMICHARKKRALILGGLLLLLFLVCLSGCSRGESGKEDDGAAQSERQEIELPPAVPAMGVGRVMPGVWAQRDELILIDPGHGFDDPGNGDGDKSWWQNLDVRERDVTLVVANMLREELEKRGFRTAFTHDGTAFPQDFNYDGNNKFMPDERAAYINYVSPDYMVSVHVNYADNQNACGAIVFYDKTSPSKWNDWSEPAAEFIAEGIDDFVVTTATTKVGNEIIYDFASYAVTRDTHCAASLIEMGFASNEVDAQYMLREDWQRSMAEGIAEGIARFFASMDP